MNESLLELTTRAGRKYTYALKLNVALAVAKAHGNGGIFFTKSGDGQTFSIDLKNVISIEITEVGTSEPKAKNIEHHNCGCGRTVNMSIPEVDADVFKNITNSMSKHIIQEHKSEFSRFLQGKTATDHSEGLLLPPNVSKENVKSNIETDLVPDYSIKNNETTVQRDLNKVLYKIDCGCGATYFARLFADTNFCACRECGERVFVDRFAPQSFGDNKEPATLITNKYYVTRADSKPSREIV